jgi:hypothetical protein
VSRLHIYGGFYPVNVYRNISVYAHGLFIFQGVLLVAYTFPQLKQIRDNIIMSFGISSDNATRVVAFYNVGENQDHDIIDKMLSGDLSSVPAALSALGIVSSVQASADDRPQKADSGKEGRTAEKTPKRSADLDKKTAKRSPKNSKNDTRTTVDNTTDIQAPVSPLASPLCASDTLTDKIPADSIKDRTKQNTVDIIQSADILPAIDGDIIPANNSDSLPPALPSMVDEWLFEFSQKYNIDLQKCAGLQWRAACLFIGQHIQAADILTDKTRPYKVYNPNRVAALIPLYEALTATYKHIALASDFIAFSGVSREWFYDSQKRGLTSACVDIRKKLQAIEESSLSAGLVDSRENPTGRIFYSKARLGWRESVEIVHTSAAPSVGLAELPKLTTSGDLG